jgi:mono/diheme cytochrome c family protein
MMRERRVRRSPGGAYARLLRSVVIGGVLLLMLGIVALTLRPQPRSGPGQALDPDDARLVAEGQALYGRYCAACHGAQLEGQPGWQEIPPGGPAPAPPLDGSAHAWHHPDAQLFGIVRDGGQAYSPQGYVNAMPAFGGTLSDAEIRAVLSYIKSTWPAEVRTAQPTT